MEKCTHKDVIRRKYRIKFDCIKVKNFIAKIIIKYSWEREFVVDMTKD